MFPLISGVSELLGYRVILHPPDRWKNSDTIGTPKGVCFAPRSPLLPAFSVLARRSVGFSLVTSQHSWPIYYIN